MFEIPHSEQAERAVIGAMIANYLQPPDSGLTAEDFHLQHYRQMFGAISELHENGEEINVVCLADELKKRHVTASIYELSELVAGIPFGLKFDKEIKLLRQKTTRRKIQQLGSALMNRAALNTESNQELIADAAELLDTLRSEQRTQTDGFRPLSEIALEAADKYRALAKGTNFNIPTGIGELDRVTRGGVAMGDIWIVGAFTGQGKSAFALQMARNQAEQGYTVGIISREMLDFENFERLHSASSQTPLWLIKPQMDNAVLDHLERTLPRVAELPIFIDSSNGDILKLRQQIKKLVEKQGAKIIYVDYLQLLEAGNGNRNWSRANEVEKCSRTLKAIAMDLQIGIVALAQYNRMSAYAGKAENHSFADSSAIEKDASVVLHLELEKVEEGAEIPKWRRATIRVGKGRQSPHIVVDLNFRGECFTFTDKSYTEIHFDQRNQPEQFH